MKIAFFSSQPFDEQSFNQIQHHHTIDYHSLPLNEATTELAAGADAVCVFVNDCLDEKCIALLANKGVKLIALRCAGFNNVDLNAAQNHNIAVVRVPAYSPYAVAEHALALLLTLIRKTHKAYNRVREGNFSLNGLLGFDLYGKKVGLIGLGKIGQCVANIFQGFSCSVQAFDPYSDNETVARVPLEHVLKTSDIISLHCPLNDKTRHMIDRTAIEQMKTGVTLINTGRGGLIDSRALIDGLKQEKIGAVALDVYEQEEGVFFTDHSCDIIQDDVLTRLMSFPNVLITSHQGFFTAEALHEIASVTLGNITAVENSGCCENQL